MERLQLYVPAIPNDNTVRLLRAFLDNLPANGRANLIRHLESLQSDEEIRQHADSLVNGLLIPMRALRSAPSISSRDGMADSIENVAAQSGGPATRQSQLKQQCLARDDTKCVISGLYDEKSMEENITNIRTTRTKCAHIIPFSLATWKDEQEEYVKNIIWTNLTRCFPVIQSQIRFTRDQIHDTRNAITLSNALHESFGAFEFAFEETQRRHTYTLKNYKPRLLFDLPETVSLASHDRRYSLPSPGLLKIHATIARILHASGAADRIDKTIRDLDETPVISKDGSTDLAALLAATSLGPLGSRPGNTQQVVPGSPGKRAQSPPGEGWAWDDAESQSF